MTDDDLITSALKAFFTNYRPSKEENAADLVAVYRRAVRDFPGWAVQRAVDAFNNGHVDGASPAFRPKTGELAQEARNQIFLECEWQNGQIFGEQKRLKDDGRSDYFKHRRDELVTFESVDPSNLPALPHEDFPLLLEHRVDPAMQAKFAKVIPLNTNTTREAV